MGGSKSIIDALVRGITKNGGGLKLSSHVDEVNCLRSVLCMCIPARMVLQMVCGRSFAYIDRPSRKSSSAVSSAGRGPRQECGMA